MKTMVCTISMCLLYESDCPLIDQYRGGVCLSDICYSIIPHHIILTASSHFIMIPADTSWALYGGFRKKHWRPDLYLSENKRSSF